MKRICFYHAGCPDGFGAAWAVWNAWGEAGRYVPRGHDDRIRVGDYEGALVTYVDIAPHNDELCALAELAESVVILDHHVSSRDRFESDPDARNAAEDGGHTVHFDLHHSGAVLAWQHFLPDQPSPALLRYVEDQDLWNWKLPSSREINAAIASYPRTFGIWSELASRPPEELARQGEPIVRSNQMEVERVVHDAFPVTVERQRVEAANASHNRSSVGHELALRAAYGVPCGCVFRVIGDRVFVTLYSVGEYDVAAVAARFGGGGHRNAAGFNVSLRTWLEDFV